MKKAVERKLSSPDRAHNNPDKIVIDEAHGLVFSSEDELYKHFFNEIQILEKEFFSLRDNQNDVPEPDFVKHEKNLSRLLEDPDEVWEDDQSLPEKPVIIYLREVKKGKGNLFHVAVCYTVNEVPSFVYLHFPTRDSKLVEKYRRGRLIYDRASGELPIGALEGDALTEGDALASGLYNAMNRLRNDKDIPEAQFGEYGQYREPTLAEADEIWRNADTMGNVLVSFIKDFSDQADNDLFYIVVALEDSPSNSHALLFSFPTTDKTLVDRYRHGENLQAEEVVQEASH